MSSKNFYNIDVTWKKPEISPDYYIIEISDRNMKIENYDVKVVVQNVTGTKIGVYFSDVEINGIFYEVIVTAFSKKGSSFDEVFLEIDQSLLDSGKIFIKRKKRNSKKKVSLKFSIFLSLQIVPVFQ